MYIKTQRAITVGVSVQKIGGLNMGTIIIYILLVIGLIISTIASEETCKKRKKEILNFKDWLQTKKDDELNEIVSIYIDKYK